MDSDRSTSAGGGTGAVGAHPAVDREMARARLNQERARVSGLATELRATLGQPEHEEGWDDTANETTQRTEDLSILDELEAELEEIDAALRRIDDGTYGIDEETGEPIDPARLDAVPTARTNVPGRADRR